MLKSWNCQKNGIEPQWHLYDAIEMQGNLAAELEDGSTVVKSAGDCDPEFWTVYGHSVEFGGVIALHDCASEDEAQQLISYCEQKVSDYRAIRDTLSVINPEHVAGAANAEDASWLNAVIEWRETGEETFDEMYDLMPAELLDSPNDDVKALAGSMKAMYEQMYL